MTMTKLPMYTTHPRELDRIEAVARRLFAEVRLKNGDEYRNLAQELSSALQVIRGSDTLDSSAETKPSSKCPSEFAWIRPGVRAVWKGIERVIEDGPWLHPFGEGVWIAKVGGSGIACSDLSPVESLDPADVLEGHISWEPVAPIEPCKCPDHAMCWENLRPFAEAVLDELRQRRAQNDELRQEVERAQRALESGAIDRDELTAQHLDRAEALLKERTT